MNDIVYKNLVLYVIQSLITYFVIVSQGSGHDAIAQ